MSDYLEKNGILYQFLYGNLFPKCFSRINDYGVKAKTLFNTYYQNLNLQKNILNWQNSNLQIKREEVNELEQKPCEEEKYDNASPLNMTTLDVKPIKKKRKVNNNNESKEQKRQAKKQKLLLQLQENTEKLKNFKKKK